jgi:FixJ family two-component response regulator
MDGAFSPSELKNPLLAEVPVVIISGCRDVTPKAKEVGAVAFMYRPVAPQTLSR